MKRETWRKKKKAKEKREIVLSGGVASASRGNPKKVVPDDE